MFFKIGAKKSDVQLAVLVPNFITTLSLCCGLASIHFSLVGTRWDLAIAAIALSMVFDALDGRAARLLRVSSKFGAVLDSLSDFVSFGVAPAIILHEWLLTPAVTPIELGAVMIYALCAGMRLARFTAAVPSTKPAGPSSNYFTGMPTPGAAAAVMIPAMYELSNVSERKIPQLVIAALALTIGLLMVSRVPTFAFKKISVNRRLVVPMMILLGLIVVNAILHFWLTLTILSTINVLLIPFAVLVKNRRRSAEQGSELTPAAAIGEGTGSVTVVSDGLRTDEHSAKGDRPEQSY